MSFKNVIKNILERFTDSGTKAKRELSTFLDTGFHGDRYLLGVVHSILTKCNYFIETGTNVGSTLAYVARTFPGVECLSCEPDPEAFDEVRKHVSEYSNVSIYNMTSQEFIEFLKVERSKLFGENVLFWLDAHGYGFQWPLKEELKFITESFEKAYILIDDFKVPGKDCFIYDKYDNQICSFDFVKDALSPKHQYKVFYPGYTEKTSKLHPLCGWGLIEFGHQHDLVFVDDVKTKVDGPFIYSA